MSNQWFRLYAEFASDPKVQMMSETMQRRLIMLFCFRCNGHVTLRNEEVTFLLRISNEEWEETRQLFFAKGFINENNELVNWEKRQFRSDSSRERVARHREKMKHDDVTTCNVTVTPQNRTDTEQNRTDIKKTTNVVTKKNGTRFSIPDLPTDWEAFCRKERPDLEPQMIFQIFSDHWKSKPGKDGVKLDWQATWRNWVRNQKAQNLGVNYAKQPTKDERARAAVMRAAVAGGFASQG